MNEELKSMLSEITGNEMVNYTTFDELTYGKGDDENELQ